MQVRIIWANLEESVHELSINMELEGMHRFIGNDGTILAIELLSVTR